MTKPLAALTLALFFLGMVTGCNTTAQSPDVSTGLRQSLDQSGLHDVSIDQDRDRGVVTLGGHVASEAEKAQAESIARAHAGTQVVANQVAVEPPGDSKADSVQSSLDNGIGSNLDAALTRSRLDSDVDYAVENGVVTLTGDVNSQQLRTQAAEIARSIPNVKQVVNELQVTNQKATSTK